MVTPPINYDAVRAALVQAVRSSTGLGQNSVIMMESEEPVGVRPDVPFAALKFTTTAIKSGWDSMEHAGLDGDQSGMFIYSGQRSLICAFDFYGESHEQAYGMAAAFQSALDVDVIFEALAEAGLAVWRADQVVDLSALLSTAYEGRAHLTVQFGLVAQTQVDVGYIAHVPVYGNVLNDTGTAAVGVDFSADLNGE